MGKKKNLVENKIKKDDDEEMYDSISSPSTKDKDVEMKDSTSEADITPFMDTFWNLADDSSAVRAKAGRDLLLHCFSEKDPEENEEALLYTLGRLIDGLNSGRASARQGFASCLSSFLKIAFSSNGSIVKQIMIHYYKQKQASDDNEELDENEESLRMNPEVFLHNELLRRTEYSNSSSDKQNSKKGKKKKNGMEERNYAFGRLFGILAICRSGVISELTEEYVKDLLTLFRWKSWIREPAAHALIELLDISDKPDRNIINDILVPELIESEDYKYTAEAIAVKLYVERKTSPGKSFFDSLSKDKEFEESICQSLIHTAACTTIINTQQDDQSKKSNQQQQLQRRHLLWNQVWKLFHDKQTKESTKSQILNFVFGPFMTNYLLTASSCNTSSNSNINKGVSSAARKTLALALLMDYTCYADISDSSSSILSEVMFTPHICKILFVNTISAKGGSNSQGHTLKNMATYVLETIISYISATDESKKILKMLQSLIQTDPKFDHITKTQSVSQLTRTLIRNTIGENCSDNKENLIFSLMSYFEEEILDLSNSNNSNKEEKEENEEDVASEDEKQMRKLHGLIELYSIIPKHLFTTILKVSEDKKTENSESSHSSLQTQVQNRVLSFLFTCAFFDCSSSTTSEKTKKNKKSKKSKKKGSDSVGVEIASKLSSLKTMNLMTRRILACRFHSILSDSILSYSFTHGNKSKSHKTHHALQVLSYLMDEWKSLESEKMKLHEPIGDFMEEEEDDEDESSETKDHVKEIHELHAKAMTFISSCDTSDPDSDKKVQSVIVGNAVLVLTLYFQLLHPGKYSSENQMEVEDKDEEENMELMEIEEEEEEERNQVKELIHELIMTIVPEMTSILTSEKTVSDEGDEEEGNPLALLADICSNTLSLFEKSSSSSSRSTKLLRESTKMAWSHCLSASLDSDGEAKSLVIDELVMRVVLESVIGPSDEGEDYEEDEEMEERAAEEEDSTSDGGDVDMQEDNGQVFQQAAKSGLDVEKDDEDSSDTNSSSSEKEVPVDDNSIELDTDQLQNLLLEDKDDPDDLEKIIEDERLEHHAGADKALAQLIKLQQQQRKKQQGEQERLMYKHRLRCCVILFETLFSYTPKNNAGLVFMTLLPILKRRKQIEKTVLASQKNSINTRNNNMAALNAEKKTFMEKLTQIFKQKICKSKFVLSSNEAIGKDDERITMILSLSKDILEEAKKSSSSVHCSCCSNALLLILRLLENLSYEETDTFVRDIYGEALEHWSTKRSSKIQPNFLEEFFTSDGGKKLTLIPNLIQTIENGRSIFHKIEAFRFISLLYVSPDEKGAQQKSILDVFKTLNSTLEDQEMITNMKTKRLRDLLKTSETLITFHNSHVLSLSDSDLDLSWWKSLKTELNTLSLNLTKLSVDSSSNIKSTCSKMVEHISENSEKLQEKIKELEKMKTPKASKSSSSKSTSKKSKKKSKKKK